MDEEWERWQLAAAEAFWNLEDRLKTPPPDLEVILRNLIHPIPPPTPKKAATARRKRKKEKTTDDRHRD